MAETIALRDGEVGLFGYGSLLLKSSMERTLARPYPGRPIPCRVDGWRRAWNSIFPNERFFYMIEGHRQYPRNIIYLNVVQAAGAVNGLLYVIDHHNLEGFDRRELTYTRVDVHDRLDQAVIGGPVWMYVGKPPYVLEGSVPVEEAAVRRTYIEIVESGLSELGDGFR